MKVDLLLEYKQSFKFSLFNFGFSENLEASRENQSKPDTTFINL